MTVYASRMESPVGPLTLVVDAGGALTKILFGGPGIDGAEPGDARCAQVRTQLGEYFRGERREFALQLAPAGTPFQQQVWHALGLIPYGTTLDYRELGQVIGRPGAARAVGRANATNPIPIVIPCHRVVGAVGNLTGYGGGLEAKQYLLRLEGCEFYGEAVSAGSWMSVTHPELYGRLIPYPGPVSVTWKTGVTPLS